MRNIVLAAILAAAALITFLAADSLLPFSQAKNIAIEWLTAPGLFLAYPLYPSEIHGGAGMLLYGPAVVLGNLMFYTLLWYGAIRVWKKRRSRRP